jgi:hypothetical protein
VSTSRIQVCFVNYEPASADVPKVLLVMQLLTAQKALFAADELGCSASLGLCNGPTDRFPVAFKEVPGLNLAHNTAYPGSFYPQFLRPHAEVVAFLVHTSS